MTDRNIIICGHGSGTPSTKNLSAYSASRYNSKAKNGKRKGVVAVKRPKDMTDSLRTKFHDTYRLILGRNVYSQNLRKYVFEPYNGKYYSDCSSSGCATYKKIGLAIDLLNTAGMYNSGAFETVNIKIENGHITNPEVLKVGDAIFFVGDDPSRPLQIGHVEFVYEVDDSTVKTVTTTTTTVKTSTSECYTKYTGKSDSIVDALKAVGVTDTSKTHRAKIAKANGISGYTGTASQNTEMLILLKGGKLIKA
jgi:hypothetical protein